MDKQREHAELGLAGEVVHGAGHALDNRVHGLEVRWVRGELDRDGVAVARREDVVHAQVVLDVAAALNRVLFDADFELAEHLLVGLAHDVDQHIEAAAVGHAQHDLAKLRVGGIATDGVEDRNGRLAAFDAEALGAGVLAVEEALERLGRVEPFEDVALLGLVGLAVDALDALLDPTLLFGVLDVHVVDADRAAVRIAHLAEDVSQDHLARRRLAGRCVVGVEELAVEVPDRQAVGLGIDVEVAGGLTQVERIEIGDEVASDPVHVHALVDLDLLEQGLVGRGGRAVRVEVDRGVRHAERLEEVVVEAVLTDEKLGHGLEELAGLSALDDAVVVRARDRDDLGDTEIRDRAGIGRLPFGGQRNRADADDDTLVRHEAGHGLDGANAAGVRERHGGATEVVHRELVDAGTSDQRVVGIDEATEVERVDVAQRWHEQGAASVGLVDVDGHAEPDVVVAHDAGLAIGTFGEGRVHRGHVIGDGSYGGPGDQVGEAGLAEPVATQVAVDDATVRLEHLGGYVTEAGRRRYAEAGFHVVDDRGRSATERVARFWLRFGRRCFGCWSWSGWCGSCSCSCRGSGSRCRCNGSWRRSCSSWSWRFGRGRAIGRGAGDRGVRAVGWRFAVARGEERERVIIETSWVALELIAKLFEEPRIGARVARRVGRSTSHDTKPRGRAKGLSQIGQNWCPGISRG